MNLNDKLGDDFNQFLDKIYNENIKNKFKELNLELLESLTKNIKLIEELEKVQKENLILKRKYKSLSESKAGKLTLKYWKLKNKKSRR